MTESSVVLCAPARTAIGMYGRGLVTLCIGGGQGVALALEAMR